MRTFFGSVPCRDGPAYRVTIHLGRAIGEIVVPLLDEGFDLRLQRHPRIRVLSAQIDLTGGDTGRCGQREQGHREDYDRDEQFNDRHAAGVAQGGNSSVSLGHCRTSPSGLIQIVSDSP